MSISTRQATAQALGRHFSDPATLLTAEELAALNPRQRNRYLATLTEDQFFAQAEIVAKASDATAWAVILYWSDESAPPAA